MPKDIKLLDELKMGDVIIMIGASERFGVISQQTIGMQSLIRREQGLTQATHVGIASKDQYIAHLTSHFRESSQQDFFARSTNCSFIVYRPKEKEICEAVGQVLEKDKAMLKEKLKWTRGKVAGCVLPSVFHPGVGYTEISENSTCSKFVVQVLKKSLSTLPDKKSDDYIGISSNSLPKTVDDYLYRNDHYDVYIKPKENNLYTSLLFIVVKILEYYELKKDAQDKYAKLDLAYTTAVDFIYEMEKNLSRSLDDIEKTLILMTHLAAPLSIKRGSMPSKNYKKVIAMLNQNGIRESDFISLTPEKLQAKFSQKSNNAPAESKPYAPS